MNTDGLSDEEIRVKVAAAMGFHFWKKISDTYVGCFMAMRGDHVPWSHPDFKHHWEKTKYFDSDKALFNIPKYTTDLNTCAEFEEPMMMNSRYERYLAKLAVICGNDFYEHRTHWSPEIVSATARQRCLAFLRTLP